MIARRVNAAQRKPARVAEKPVAAIESLHFLKARAAVNPCGSLHCAALVAMAVPPLVHEVSGTRLTRKEPQTSQIRAVVSGDVHALVDLYDSVCWFVYTTRRSWLELSP